MERSISQFLENCFEYIHNYGVVSVAGGSGSGKGYFSNMLSKKIGFKVVSLDDYIIPEKITPNSNWDLPECWDLELLKNNLIDFKNRREFEKPIYDFKIRSNNKYEIMSPEKGLILEGLYSIHSSLRGFVDFSIFIDVNEKERLKRVLKRDINERGTKTKEEIIKRWDETVQPYYRKLVEPQKKVADIVLSNY